MAKGGHREGAGRKKGSKGKLSFKNIVTQNDINTCRNKLMELVKGVRVRKIKKDGEEVIYDIPPSAAAADMVLKHSVGMPVQPIEFEDKTMIVDDVK